MERIDKDNEEFIAVAQKTIEILQKPVNPDVKNNRIINITDRTIPEDEKRNLSMSQIDDIAKLMSDLVIRHDYHKINSKDLKRAVEEIKGKYKV